MKLLIFVLPFVYSLTPALAYYGRHSTEAILTYQSKVDLDLGFVPTIEALSKPGRVQTIAMQALDAQIQHLMGTFQSQSFIKAFKNPGVLGESYEVVFLKSSPSPRGEKGRALIEYRFKGKVVFSKNAFRSNRVRHVPLKLPLAPDLIYETSFGDKKESLNYCTDEEYNTEFDFWYFWDPEQKGCPLSHDNENVLRFDGTLKMLESTELTYPDYDKLYGNNFNGNNLDIAVFYGYINDVNSLRRAPRGDDGRIALNYLDSALRDSGFSLYEKKDAFRVYQDERETRGINYLRKYEKTIRALGKQVHVRILVLLADTEIESKDITFHRYLVNALKSADIVVYDGHSGLGDTLNLASLPRFQFNQDKYQLFFFNGCSSYPYYTGSFFTAKGGTENLDILSAGLPTYSSNSGPNTVSFLNSFIEGRTRSYQKILSDLENSNSDQGWFLLGVSGDEDNSWYPR